MALCRACEGIPTDFFDPVPDDFFSPADRQFHYRHLTPTALRQSAQFGCPICKILACRLNDGWLEQEDKDTRPLTLKRAIIDPVEGFGLFMGHDDISHNHFYRVPESYKKTLPAAHVDETDDEESLMRHWISDCKDTHGRCDAYNDIASCPTRVLDVSCFHNSNDIVLKELDENVLHISYAALSHCWGDPSHPPITTTTTNLAVRKTRIAFDDLTKSFQDAVTITRKLEIPYLWIDSLCIIQDSKSDCEKEVSKMATVYVGAVVTLSALGSPDSNGGFYLHPPKEKTDFVYRHDITLGSQRYRVFVCQPESPNISGPLLERAWTYQERELSPRILHFGRHNLIWECKQLTATTSLPWLRYKAYDSDRAPALIYDSHEESLGKWRYSYEQRKHWFLTVTRYSCRSLTHAKDKLIALSGLAHNVHEAEKGGGFRFLPGEERGRYLAGLWEGDMPSALLWQTIQPPSDETQAINASPRKIPSRPAQYRAPSWSWASVEGEVTYNALFLERNSEYGGMWIEQAPPHKPSSAEYAFSDLKITDIKVKSTTDVDPMGSVEGGVVKLRGPAATVIVDEETEIIKAYGHATTSCSWLRTLDGDVVGALFADMASEVEAFKEVWVVGVRAEPEGAEIKMPERLVEHNFGQVGEKWERGGMVMGLALVKSQAGAEGRGGILTYRLGLVRWMRKALFEGCETRSFNVF